MASREARQGDRETGRQGEKKGLCLFLLVSLSPCLLVSLSAPAADTADPLEFTATTADGTALTGPIEELTKDGTLRLGKKEPNRVAAGDLISLRRTRRSLPAFPQDEQIVFVNGDRLAVPVDKVVSERIHLKLPPEWRSGGEVTVPLTAAAVLWRVAPEEDEHPERLLRRLTTGQRIRDLVLLRNGDTVEGAVTGIDDGKVQVELDGKVNAVPLAKVAAVALNTELSSSLTPKGTYVRATLADGSRLSLTDATSDGKDLAGTTLFKAPVKIPLDHVIALDVFQGKAVYLSDLKPKKYEFTPFDEVKWPFVLDGSVDGGDLRMRGSTHAKGIGVHSESRLTYDLGGKYKRFEALVGLDDERGRGGSVRIRVLVDGKEQDLGADKDVTHRGGPLVVKVNVAGARELTLVTEFGQHGNVGDRVDWVDARLVK